MFFDCSLHSSVPAEFLFNQDVYLLKQHKPYWTAYTSGADKLLCRLTALPDDQYVSGYHATYGGIEGLPISSLDRFVKDILLQLKERGAKQFTLKQVPFFYQPEFYSHCHHVLLDNGFELQVSEKSQYLRVDAGNSFDAGLAYEKRRLLNKLKESGAECRLYETVPGEEWYQLFQHARALKGFPLTLTRSEYEGIAETIKGVYTHAGVFIKDRLIAAAIIVQVSDNSLYYFFAASDAEYNALSPAVLIIEEMYHMAVRKKCSTIDMGISSLDGVINNGLYFFKQQLGAKDSEKNIYTFQFL